VIRTTSQGTVTLTVHIVPRAKRSAILGEHGGALKIAIAAPPTDGAANEALMRFLAEILGVGYRDVRLISGATGRRKVISIGGSSLEKVAKRLQL
jgi:uncharacterized protein (TIGR00251 family)